MVLETRRLVLREMKPDDFQALFLVLGDPETMRHYPYIFERLHVRDWIERTMNRYRRRNKVTKGPVDAVGAEQAGTKGEKPGAEAG